MFSVFVTKIRFSMFVSRLTTFLARYISQFAVMKHKIKLEREGARHLSPKHYLLTFPFKFYSFLLVTFQIWLHHWVDSFISGKVQIHKGSMRTREPKVAFAPTEILFCTTAEDTLKLFCTQTRVYSDLTTLTHSQFFHFIDSFTLLLSLLFLFHTPLISLSILLSRYLLIKPHSNLPSSNASHPSLLSLRRDPETCA